MNRYSESACKTPGMTTKKDGTAETSSRNSRFPGSRKLI